MERRRYTREFKIEAVRQVVEGGRVLAEVSRDLGISENMLQRWKKQFRAEGVDAFPGNGKVPIRDEEIRRLKRELEQARQENAFLKKAAAYFAKESR